MNTDCVLIEDDDVDMYPVEIVQGGFEIKPLLEPFTLEKATEALEEEFVAMGETLIEDETEPRDSPSEADTIMLEDYPIQTSSAKNYNEDKNQHHNGTTLSDKEAAFARSLKNNALMNKFIQKCLSMNSTGIPRVLNKTLLPCYEKTHNTFKGSEELTKLLEKALNALKTDPLHKFLHIKELNETLKENRFRRKVGFVTLATNLQNYKRIRAEKHKKSTATPMPLQTAGIVFNSHRNYWNNPPGGNEEVAIIDLDNSDEETVINLDDDDDNYNRECIVLDDNNGCNANKENNTGGNPSIAYENIYNNADKINYANKKKNVTKQKKQRRKNKKHKKNDVGNTKTKHTDQNIEAIVPTSTKVSDTSEKNVNCSNTSIESPKQNTNSGNGLDYDLLIPTNHLEYNDPVSDNAQMIIQLEEAIKERKIQITHLEEQEVTSDNKEMSPYLICARLKEEVVKMYKELCKLNNSEEEVVKRREVRLSVREGHPPGPTKKLEEFLRSSMDENGLVPLPDFHDVIMCVTQSNFDDNLNWSRGRIMSEAIALFRECGQALRKVRQKREYKDLMSLVRDKNIDDDPAVRDPELLAKLEENRIIAHAKEDELLERFARLEGVPSCSQLRFNLQQNDDDITDSDNEANSGPSGKFIRILPYPNQKENGESSKTNVGSFWPTVTICNGKIVGSTSNLDTCQPNIRIVPEKTVSIDSPSKNTSNSDQNSNYLGTPTQSTGISDSQNRTSSVSEQIVNDLEPPIQCTNISEGIVNSSHTPSQGTNISVENVNNLVKPIRSSSISEQNVNSLETQDDKCTISEHYSNSSSILTIEDNTSIEAKENIDNETPLSIKQEPIDWQSVLDGLGDNYTLSVFDIEDPFLVVDISSDSSSDEL